MMTGFIQASFHQADHRGEVVSLSGLPGVTWRSVFCRPAKVFQRPGQIDQMIQEYVCNRAMNCEIWIIAFLRLEEVAKRFFVPSVEIGSLRTFPVGSRLALEFGQPDLLKDVVQRVLLHLEHPDQIAHQQVEIRAEALNAGGELVKPE